MALQLIKRNIQYKQIAAGKDCPEREVITNMPLHSAADTTDTGAGEERKRHKKLLSPREDLKLLGEEGGERWRHELSTVDH